MKLVSILVLIGASAAPALAQQVGYPPAQSPYHDVPYKQEVTFYGGWFKGSTGDVGVAPGSGPLFGIRYSIHLGGPAEFVAHLARASTTRHVIDPAQNGAARDVGDVNFPLYLADVGLSLNLTGQKSFHRLIPVFTFGAGLASDAHAKPDVGGYKFGTPFALTVGGGLRYVPGGNWSLRADVADYLYQVSYPSSYLTAPAGGTAVLGPSAATKQWTHNAVLTLGISYLYSR